MVNHSMAKIAVAGAGDSGRYLVEQCQAENLSVSVISRAVSEVSLVQLSNPGLTRHSSQPRDWFSSRGVDVHVSDYTHDSLLDILNKTKATVLVSLLHDNDPDVMVRSRKAF